MGRVRKAVCALFKEIGSPSQDKGLFSSAELTHALPTCSCAHFGDTLMQPCNSVKSLYETKHCKKHSFKRNSSLHVYYASLIEQRKPSQQADPREGTSIWTLHSTKCRGLAPHIPGASVVHRHRSARARGRPGLLSLFRHL